MSMTESEAIERIKKDICNGNPNCICRDACMYGKGKCAYDMAMRALEEVQQYREYREIFESHFTEDALKLFSDKEEFSKWFERGKWHVLKCDELGREVEEYRAIGTVSEFRENKNFLEFLYNAINPNEMEQYLAMYHASGEKGE